MNFIRTHFFQSLRSSVFVALLFVVTGHASSVFGDDANALFSRGKWREALRQYQVQVDQLCSKQNVSNSNGNAFTSNLIETDSDLLLKAHCLFERGALAFLKTDPAGAVKDWSECRNIILSAPKVGAIYLRRVNMALAKIWLPSTTSKELRFFDEGLTQICKTIDDSPLPEDSLHYRYQLQTELQFTLTKTLVSTIHLLYVKHGDENYDDAIITQKLVEFWGHKALCRILIEGDTERDSSHEALLDRTLFYSPESDFYPLAKEQVLRAWRGLSPSVYSEVASAMSVFAFETGQGNALQAFLGKDIDPKSLDKIRFGTAISRLLKDSARFSAFDRAGLLRGLCNHPDLVSWTGPDMQIEIATILAEPGGGDDALRLLREVGAVPVASPLYARFCVALAKSTYAAGQYEKSVSVGEDGDKALTESLPASLFYWRALSYAKLRRPSDAARYLQEFLRRAPQAAEAPEACFFLANLCLSSGKKAEAQQYFIRTATAYAGTPWADRAQNFMGNLK